MPGRNILKIDLSNSVHHVYSRGVNKMTIFKEREDFEYFVRLLVRYLGDKEKTKRDGSSYPNFRGRIELVCYCLMSNHFHMMIKQKDPGDMGKFMQALLTSYVYYFNAKYERRGPLFESRFRASHVDSEAYAMYLSKYIHKNPARWLEYEYSSIGIFVGVSSSLEFLKPELILDGFVKGEYMEFLETEDIVDNKYELYEI